MKSSKKESKMFAFFTGCSSYHGFLLRDDGALFCFGSNSNGQCGLEKEKKILELKRQNFFGEFPQIQDIVLGYNHTIFHLKNGEIFGCGKNSSGPLNFGNFDTDVTEPKRSLKISKESCDAVKKVSAGSESTFFVTAIMEVHAVGWNSYGGLGVGDQTNRCTAVKVEINEEIKQVEAGWQITCFFTRHGNLFVCGYNNDGRLPVASRTAITVPTRISFFDDKLFKVVKVTEPGDEAIFLITDKRECYAFGKNSYDVFALPSDAGTDFSEPKKVEVMENVVIVTGGCCSSIWMDVNGVLYSMGKNSNGQLGHGHTNAIGKNPLLVPTTTLQRNVLIRAQYEITDLQNERIVQFHSGLNQTYFINSKGEIFRCGMNNDGSLFDGTSTSKPSVSKYEGLKLMRINKKSFSYMERFQFLTGFSNFLATAVLFL